MINNNCHSFLTNAYNFSNGAAAPRSSSHEAMILLSKNIFIPLPFYPMGEFKINKCTTTAGMNYKKLKKMVARHPFPKICLVLIQSAMKEDGSRGEEKRKAFRKKRDKAFEKLLETLKFEEKERRQKLLFRKMSAILIKS